METIWFISTDCICKPWECVKHVFSGTRTNSSIYFNFTTNNSVWVNCTGQLHLAMRLALSTLCARRASYFFEFQIIFIQIELPLLLMAKREKPEKKTVINVKANPSRWQKSIRSKCYESHVFTKTNYNNF